MLSCLNFKRRFMSILLIIVLIVGYMPSVKAIDDTSENGNIYYVATNGSDSNDGKSLDIPFKTIQKAASIMQPGDTCYIRGGVYNETIIPENGGTTSERITFKNYNDETVTVSGCDPITGWTLDSGNIYKASMDWDLGFENQIFADGQLMD